MNAAPTGPPTGRSRPLVVAIDGPSGSGKSSVSRTVAARLGLRYLDTGAMYRALTWWCRERGIDLDDEAAVTVAARELPLTMGTDPAAPRVDVDGTDITSAVRDSTISSVVSRVARHLPVRADLVARQRDHVAKALADGVGIVAEGRDVTTVVAPDADVRILLTASPAARLARRSREVRGRADAAGVAATRDEVLRRDADDSAVADFLAPAPGVVLLDTSDLDQEQSVTAVLELVARAGE